MDHREFGDHAAVQDAEWRSRVREAARADVRAMLRANRRRRAERWLVTATVLVAIVAVLMLAVGIGLFDSGRRGSDLGADRRGDPATLVVDPADPFARTPAASWADGAAGITAPPPMRVGEFSAEEVSEATALVREALVASRFDRAMVVDHDPGRWLSLMAEDARKVLVPPFADGEYQWVQALVSLAAPGSGLLPVEPKVTGGMSVEAGDVGELIVHTNYVFAYAFSSPTPVTDPMDVVVVVRADVDYIIRRGPHWAETSNGLWYGYVGGYGYSIACDSYQRGFLAPAHADRTSPHTPVPGQERDRYFDPSAGLPVRGGCP